MNRAPVVIPWFTICSTEPSMPWVLRANRPMMAKPMWATDE